MADQPFVIREYQGRQLRKAPDDPWVSEASPPVPDPTGHYPGPALATSFRVSFDIALQGVELNEYPEPVIVPAAHNTAKPLFDVYREESRKHKTVVPIPWALPLVPPALPSFALARSFRVSFDIRRIDVQLDEYPPTPPVPYPSYVLEKVFRTDFNIRRLDVRLDEYPVTPLSSESYPSFVPPLAFRTEFSVEHLKVILDEYPTSPLTPAVYPSFLAPVMFKSEFSITLIKQRLDEYKAPIPPDPTGHFPGSALATGFKSGFFGFKLLRPTQLDQYPVTPPPPPPAWNVINKGAAEVYVAIAKGTNESFSDTAKGANETWVVIDKGDDI